ncbi:hypothetical protein RB653_004980 [Dictyostelium firmibasis]|uniref:Carbohydrate binding domain-containing protein n=1 Tax=Dictyostelium firmibasis TaxID=79012 RepID=A0AAN7Z0L6_9MYCE
MIKAILIISCIFAFLSIGAFSDQITMSQNHTSTWEDKNVTYSVWEVILINNWNATITDLTVTATSNFFCSKPSDFWNLEKVSEKVYHFPSYLIQNGLSTDQNITFGYINQEQDSIYRIVIIGNDYECGIKSILRRFTYGEYSPLPESQVGVEFEIKMVRIDDEEIKLQIWPFNRYLTEKSDDKKNFLFKGAHGFMLVYGCHSQKSFDDLLNDWIAQIDKYSNEFSKKNMVLICNNSETPETYTQKPNYRVDPYISKQWAFSKNIPFFDVNPKENINVYESFIQLSKLIKNNYLINSSQN